MGGVTTSPGALICLHMIHGTPVSVLTAILAAHSMYLVPSSLNATSKCWYSFSICRADSACRQPKEHKAVRVRASNEYVTCDRMMGPPCDANRLASLSFFTIRFTNLSMCICSHKARSIK
jgi:hypothetical protein